MAHRIQNILLLFLLSVAPHIAPCQASTLLDTRNHLMDTANLFSEIIERAKPGVVYIEVKKSTAARTTSSPGSSSFFNNPEIERFFDSDSPAGKRQLLPEGPSYSHGSGFIISPDGYILTNSHVIDKAEKITVTLTSRQQFPAHMVGADSRSDVGLIKIDVDEKLTILPMGSSELLKTGEWVLAMGSPFANIQTVTAGIVSATGRNSLGISDYEDFIQTDAAINPGNSGGPLVNIRGEVIGINTAFITQTGGYMGVGFAVPIDMARNVSGQLLEKGKVIRGWLGVTLKDASPEHLRKQNLPVFTRAARVVGIEAHSPAAATDLGKEDLIVSIDGITISGAADLRNRVSLFPPGVSITLGFYRDGTIHKVATSLGTLK